MREKTLNLNIFEKFLFIIEKKGVKELRNYCIFRFFGGLLDSFYIFIISIIYSQLNPSSDNSKGIFIFENFRPSLLILFVIIYFFIYLLMQRYVYFLDYKLAVNTKKRILNKFDKLEQKLKLGIDKGSFTSNLGPSFDLFHLNSITSVGVFFSEYWKFHSSGSW